MFLLTDASIFSGHKYIEDGNISSLLAGNDGNWQE
jgi:hypothetical protein